MVVDVMYLGSVHAPSDGVWSLLGACHTGCAPVMRHPSSRRTSGIYYKKPVVRTTHLTVASVSLMPRILSP
eukprot:14308538-Heterocapsa_arctica.AAC.1